MNLLTDTGNDLVSLEPYPHLVARDLLPAERVARLIAEMPGLERITQGNAPGSNMRHSYPAHKALRDPTVSEAWKGLVRGQLTQLFLDRFLALFGAAIAERYPWLATQRLRAGVRRQDCFSRADVLLEAQICVNTPVTATSSVRGPHVDMPDKLFAGLFYLRHPDDRSQGGDLELHRYRHGPRCLNGQFIDDADVEVVDRVPYESNVLVLFLNGIDAIHGVTPREPTPFPRLFLNLFGELPGPLFDLPSYQRHRSLLGSARYRLQMGQKRLLRLGHQLLR